MRNRRHFITLAAAAAAAFALGRLVDVDIVDRSQNELLPVYHQRGTAWVAGRPGSRYAVRLANRSGARVMVVLSVDGINAVTGETARLGQVGYVLMPGQSTEITGWRTSHRSGGFLLHRLARLVRCAHRPARQRGRDWRGGVPRAPA